MLENRNNYLITILSFSVVIGIMVGMFIFNFTKSLDTVDKQPTNVYTQEY